MSSPIYRTRTEAQEWCGEPPWSLSEESNLIQSNRKLRLLTRTVTGPRSGLLPVSRAIPSRPRCKLQLVFSQTSTFGITNRSLPSSVMPSLPLPHQISRWKVLLKICYSLYSNSPALQNVLFLAIKRRHLFDFNHSPCNPSLRGYR